jgi:DNA-binding MarR family transcriptional regulator
VDEADYRVLARFRFALRVFLRFSEDAARAAGLTISDLAEWLQLRHNSTVELVQRAVDAGWLERHLDEVDRRRQRLALTPRGEAVLDSLSRSHREELRRFREEMAEVLVELG